MITKPENFPEKSVARNLYYQLAVHLQTSQLTSLSPSILEKSQLVGSQGTRS